MKTRVLVVDDEDGSRTALTLLLSTWGYDVDGAESGEEALERARTFRPAIVIADLIMPGLDGLGVLKALRAELPDTVIVLLTGYATIETAVMAMREGAYDYLTKPVEPGRLSALLERALENVRMVHEVTVLRRQLQEGARAGKLRPIAPEQFVASMMGLLLFPFAIRPALCELLGFDSERWEAFLKERRRMLPDFVMAGLRP